MRLLYNCLNISSANEKSIYSFLPYIALVGGVGCKVEDANGLYFCSFFGGYLEVYLKISRPYNHRFMVCLDRRFFRGGENLILK